MHCDRGNAFVPPIMMIYSLKFESTHIDTGTDIMLVLSPSAR